MGRAPRRPQRARTRQRRAPQKHARARASAQHEREQGEAMTTEPRCGRDVSTLPPEVPSAKARAVQAIQRALFALPRQAIQLPRSRRITDTFVELAGSSRSLLDVGAGDGEIAAQVAARLGATRVTGVD